MPEAQDTVAITVWMPLCNATARNGTMQYIRRGHIDAHQDGTLRASYSGVVRRATYSTIFRSSCRSARAFLLAPRGGWLLRSACHNMIRLERVSFAPPPLRALRSFAYRGRQRWSHPGSDQPHG
eukprot:SAG25_NODE_1012_length_4300_cov_2.456082_3_plen_124_part_00